MSRKIFILIGVAVAIMAAAIAVVVWPGKTVAPTTSPATTPAQYEDLIRVDTPLPGAVVSSPLVVRGEARGGWYFEASFPLELRDADGAVLAQGYAQAQGEWMTKEYVPFESIPLTFPAQPKGSVGTLVVHNDNPSGLPENDRSLSIPVKF